MKKVVAVILYSALIVVALTLVIAIAFKPKFLQTREAERDKDGTCPHRCCKACALSFWKILLYCLLFGAIAAAVAALVYRPSREKIFGFVRGKKKALASSAT